ncbi:MAG: hypothetical protein Q4B50_00995 [Bacillota bacterium]|nr:hypothetical protein [Bacillota bacterium]
MKAIVYTSNTGFTARYAQLLGEKTSLPVYGLKEAKKELAPQTEVIYLGWLQAGQITGLKQAARRYRIGILCAVGLAPAVETQLRELRKRYQAAYPQLFYLQGGLKIEKLRGPQKWIMKIVCKALHKQIEEKEELSESDRDTQLLLEQGGDRVDPAALEPVLDCLHQTRQAE